MKFLLIGQTIPVYDITDFDEKKNMKNEAENEKYMIIQTSRIGGGYLESDVRESLPFTEESIENQIIKMENLD